MQSNKPSALKLRKMLNIQTQIALTKHKIENPSKLGTNDTNTMTMLLLALSDNRAMVTISIGLPSEQGLPGALLVTACKVVALADL